MRTSPRNVWLVVWLAIAVVLVVWNGWWAWAFWSQVRPMAWSRGSFSRASWSALLGTDGAWYRGFDDLQAAHAHRVEHLQFRATHRLALTYPPLRGRWAPAWRRAAARFEVFRSVPGHPRTRVVWDPEQPVLENGFVGLRGATPLSGKHLEAFEATIRMGEVGAIFEGGGRYFVDDRAATIDALNRAAYGQPDVREIYWPGVWQDVGYAARMLSIPAVVLLSWWIVRIERRSRRGAHGRCVRCGYDIRGIESGVCPECGHAG